MNPTIPDNWGWRNFGHSLAKKIATYLEDPEHRREFEQWYFEKYGHAYIWKKFDEVYPCTE